MSRLSDLIDELAADIRETEEPQYRASTNGMSQDAMFQRYIDLGDSCVEAEMEMSYDPPDDEAEANLVGLMAKMNSLAAICFIPTPSLPHFPWKAPVR